jgi:hypothetical protein
VVLGTQNLRPLNEVKSFDGKRHIEQFLTTFYVSHKGRIGCFLC